MKKKVTIFRAYYRQEVIGYKDFIIPDDDPEEAMLDAEHLEYAGDFPDCLDNVSDMGWVLEDVSPIEERGNHGHKK